MPLFGKKDEAEKHFEQAKRYFDRGKKEYDLTRAIEELKMAISLKPDEPKYHHALGVTYLYIPDFAVTRQVNVSFRLNELAKLALGEFEKAVSLSEEWSLSPILAYTALGEYEKAIHCARVAGDLKLVKQLEQRMAGEEAETETVERARLDARWRIEQAVMYRDLGRFKDADREYMEAGLLGNPEPAGPVLFLHHPWFYELLCELGERPPGLSQDEPKGGSSQ